MEYERHNAPHKSEIAVFPAHTESAKDTIRWKLSLQGPDLRKESEDMKRKWD